VRLFFGMNRIRKPASVSPVRIVPPLVFAVVLT